MEDKQSIMVVRSDAPTPLNILSAALERGLPVEQLAQLLALQERWEASEARRAFFAALAAFSSECPAVMPKDATVDFTNKDGRRTHYKHASFGAILQTVRPILSRHGLSLSFSVSQEHGVTVTTRLAHVAGHVETVTISAPADVSGNKNPIQAIESTVTYVSRYGTVAILGLTSGEDSDDDAQSAYDRPEYRPVPAAERKTRKPAAKKAEPKPPAEQENTGGPSDIDILSAAISDAETLDELNSLKKAGAALPPGPERDALSKKWAERRVEILREIHRDDPGPGEP